MVFLYFGISYSFQSVSITYLLGVILNFSYKSSIGKWFEANTSWQPLPELFSLSLTFLHLNTSFAVVAVFNPVSGVIVEFIEWQLLVTHVAFFGDYFHATQGNWARDLKKYLFHVL